MAEIVKIKYHKTFKVGAVDASAKSRIAITDAAINEHKFFNDLTIINNSTNDIEIVPDDTTDRTIVVPAKSSQNWSFKNDNMKFTNLYLVEASGAALAANKVTLIVMKKRLETIKEMVE